MKKFIWILLSLFLSTAHAAPISYGNYTAIQSAMANVTINNGISGQWMVITSDMTQDEATALALQVSILKPGIMVLARPLPMVMSKYAIQGMFLVSYHCNIVSAFEFLSVGGDRDVWTAFTAPTPSGVSWSWNAGSAPPPGTNSWCLIWQ